MIIHALFIFYVGFLHAKLPKPEVLDVPTSVSHSKVLVYPNDGPRLLTMPGTAASPEGWFDPMIDLLWTDFHYEVASLDYSGQGRYGEVSRAKNTGYYQNSDPNSYIIFPQHLEEARALIKLFSKCGCNMGKQGCLNDPTNVAQKIMVATHSYGGKIGEELAFGAIGSDDGYFLNYSSQAAAEMSQYVSFMFHHAPGTVTIHPYLQKLALTAYGALEKVMGPEPTILQAEIFNLFLNSGSRSFVPKVSRWLNRQYTIYVHLETLRRLGIFELEDFRRTYRTPEERALLDHLFEVGFSDIQLSIVRDLARPHEIGKKGLSTPTGYIYARKDAVVNSREIANRADILRRQSRVPVLKIDVEDVGHVAVVHHPRMAKVSAAIYHLKYLETQGMGREELGELLPSTDIVVNVAGNRVEFKGPKPIVLTIDEFYNRLLEFNRRNPCIFLIPR